MFAIAKNSLLLVFVLSSSPLALANDSDIKLIELTGTIETSEVPAEVKAQEPTANREAARRQVLNVVAAQRKEMSANGFVVGTDSIISAKDKYPEELVRHQAITKNSFQSALPDFAYAARDLNQTPFRKGRLLGFMPARSDDDKVHEVVWGYALPGLGNVIVEELSFSTIPGVSISVAEPMGNLTVNGNPATYMVMTNEKGDKGVTTIDFMSAEKMFTITVYKAITRDHNRFGELVELAESLY